MPKVPKVTKDTKRTLPFDIVKKILFDNNETVEGFKNLKSMNKESYANSKRYPDTYNKKILEKEIGKLPPGLSSDELKNAVNSIRLLGDELKKPDHRTMSKVFDKAVNRNPFMILLDFNIQGIERFDPVAGFVSTISPHLVQRHYSSIWLAELKDIRKKLALLNYYVYIPMTLLQGTYLPEQPEITSDGDKNFLVTMFINDLNFDRSLYQEFLNGVMGDLKDKGVSQTISGYSINKISLVDESWVIINIVLKPNYL